MDQDPLTSVIILENPECWLIFLIHKALFTVKQEDIKWHIFNIAPSPLNFAKNSSEAGVCNHVVSCITKYYEWHWNQNFTSLPACNLLPTPRGCSSLSLNGQVYLIHCQVVYRLSSESHLQLYMTSKEYSLLNSTQMYLLASKWFHHNFHRGSHSPTLGFSLKFFWKRKRNEPISFSPITPYMHLIPSPTTYRPAPGQGRRCLHF